MIINIRGSHGSGKSHLVRRIIHAFTTRNGRRKKPMKQQAVYKKGRKQPLYYSIGYDVLLVLGHYEGKQGGGTDNITTVIETYKLVKKYAKQYQHVIFEGILAQHSVPRMVELKQYGRVRAVVLNTPIKKCIRSVRRRRHAIGNTKPFDPKNIYGEQRRVDSGTRRLKLAGVKVKVCSRTEAFNYIMQLLEEG